MKKWGIIISITAMILGGCGEKKLPIMGEKKIQVVDGKTDTVYHTLPEFSFLNQDSVRLTQAYFKDKVCVADFFFTSCPTICPLTQKNMLKVAQHYANDTSIALLSFSIDPYHDSVNVLRQYAKRLGADTRKWQFFACEQEAVFELAQKGYFATTLRDSLQPGGYMHSGGLILSDKKRRIRGIYNGTDEKEAEKLIQDIRILQAE